MVAATLLGGRRSKLFSTSLLSMHKILVMTDSDHRQVAIYSRRLVAERLN